MARPKNQTPTYKLHSTTGLARCWVAGKWVTLGKYGSPESRAEFARIIAELAVAPASAVAPATDHESGRPAQLTTDELLLAFLKYARHHYRTPDGQPTEEVREIKRAILHLHRLYGHTSAAEFGPRGLGAVRQQMIDANWCRTLINRRVERIKRAFRWAASQELVPVTTYQALRTLPGLQKGRTEARESEPVKPVDPAHVAATRPCLGPHLRVMVDLQQLTGMRPGEVVAMTLAEIDRSGPVWLYRPGQHKTAHRGKTRTIPLGPKAQAILTAFLADRPRDPTDPLFSPREAQAERFRELRANRKSKVPPSQLHRKKATPVRAPGAAYSVSAYGYAIRKAAKKAHAPSWHPNQLRHTVATEVRRTHGLEAAQVLLGHTHAKVTELYGERDLALAVRVAAELG